MDVSDANGQWAKAASGIPQDGEKERWVAGYGPTHAGAQPGPPQPRPSAIVATAESTGATPTHPGWQGGGPLSAKATGATRSRVASVMRIVVRNRVPRKSEAPRLP